MRESIIEHALAARIERLGGVIRKIRWIGRVGAPDRVVMLRDYVLGATVWVETKATGGEPRPSQEREISRMRAAGQVVLVIDSLPLIDHYFPLPKGHP